MKGGKRIIVMDVFLKPTKIKEFVRMLVAPIGDMVSFSGSFRSNAFKIRAKKKSKPSSYHFYSASYRSSWLTQQDPEKETKDKIIVKE